MAITIEQAKQLGYGDHIYSVTRFDYSNAPAFFDSKGRLRELGKAVPGHKIDTFRITGKPKIWKRDASRVRVPFKYGLYKCGYIGTEPDCEDLDRFYLTQAEAQKALEAQIPPKVGRVTKAKRKSLEALI